MILKTIVPELNISLKADTIEDSAPIDKLLWVDKVGDWRDLLVYLQKKYDNI